MGVVLCGLYQSEPRIAFGNGDLFVVADDDIAVRVRLHLLVIQTRNIILRFVPFFGCVLKDIQVGF